MARLPPHIRLLLLAVAMSSNTTCALFVRDTCTASGRLSCASQGLSQELCCPAGSNCIPLAGKTTVMCCPSDKSCNKILPITCNLSEQDPALKPDAPIKTTALGAKLPACGSDLCCPFGYECSEDKKACSKSSDQSKPPAGISSTLRPTPSLPPTPTSDSASEPTSTATTPAANSTGASQDHGSQNQGVEKVSIIGGVVGGGLGLCLLVGLIILCIRSRSKKNAPKGFPIPRDSNGSGGPYGNMISGPILHPDSAYRSDFVLQRPEPSSSFRHSVARSFSRRFSRNPQVRESRAYNARQSLHNPFDSPSSSGQSPRMSRSSFVSEAPRIGHVTTQVPPIKQMRASRNYTSDHRLRESRSASINVFADPSDSSMNNRGTTFSDMMEQADMSGVHRNGGYVPGQKTLHVPGTTPRI